MRKYWLIKILFVLFLLLLFLPGGVRAAESVFFIDSTAEVHFGDSVDFTLHMKSPRGLERLWLFLKPEGSELVLLEVPFGDFNEVVSFQVDPSAVPLRAFGEVQYWFQADFDDGESLKSEQYQFIYLDDRFQWRALQTDHFRVYWHEGDLSFSTAAVNVAEESYTRLSQEYGDVLNGVVIDIFLYSSRSALQETMSSSAYQWVAGHADPELGQMILSIAPGPEQKMEMERQIPHELAHLFTYQIIGSSFTTSPVWLLEGMATRAELISDPVYAQVLSEAAAGNSLIPLSTLCGAFPGEGDAVYLAYAEAGSFVGFLKENHGNDSLQALLREYASGTGCEAGFLNTYGISLGQMENRWQMQVLGMNPLLNLLKQALPFLMIFGLIILLPLILSLLHRTKKEASEQGRS